MSRVSKPVSVFIAILLLSINAAAQDKAAVLKSIFDEALKDTTAFHNLRNLCSETRGRVCGSPAAARAVEMTRQMLLDAGADTVWLQKVTVPHWVRGKEKCNVTSAVAGKSELSVTALGMSEGTGPRGINAEVIEVHDFEELKKLGREKVAGKIVFFNRPADPTLINTFGAYGGSVNQRTSGPSEASALGATGALVRSATPFHDNHPHTGVTRFRENVRPIPAVAVSTADADKLSRILEGDPHLRLTIVSDCHTYPDTFSYNVIGEIKGSQKPGEYITVGGHLDAWDLGDGAHDDGGGCIQSIEMLRLFKKLGIKPLRSVRAVMFMNEEISGTGGRTYAAEAKSAGEIHYAALESDRGMMSPRGFSFDADDQQLANLQSLSSLFAPYGIKDFEKGGGGSDIGPLKALGALQIGYVPDSQRYFYYHHAGTDTFDQINIRELQMGSAAITSLIWLIDSQGF